MKKMGKKVSIDSLFLENIFFISNFVRFCFKWAGMKSFPNALFLPPESLF
jgi:hypothetical protein